MTNILLVVDVQKGFTRQNNTKLMGDKIVKLTNEGLFDYIIATKFINTKDSQYVQMMKWHHLINDDETQLIPGLDFDLIWTKSIYTCVNDGFLQLLKKINGEQYPKHVFLCGIDTDCCVLKIAVDLFENKIMPLVLIDYCASNGGNESQMSAITVLKRLIGRQTIIEGEISSKETISDIIKSKKY